MKVLVTGGGGFLGAAVCRRLAVRGDTVHALQRRRSRELDDLGVVQHLADIRDRDAVLAAADWCDAVVHCAAKAGVGGRRREYEQINVDGTRHVLAACARVGARLVYTSSPSVVHDGHDLEGADESLPYARHFLAHYPRTKAAAEGLVLGAAGRGIPAAALRPHLIWGPGDPHFLPGLAAAGSRLRLIGAGDKTVDTVYIDNAADAHLLALDTLAPESPVNGRAYFITQDEPAPFGQWINGLLAAAGLPPVTRRVPVAPAMLAAAALELLFALPGVRAAPPLTRFLVDQASTAHWFDISAARRDLGYTPSVSTAQGLARLADHLAEHPLGAVR
ncbi:MULTISPECIES: NAD-dependent epimerase/dehydratase family protein [Actinomadura]|uniref:NAD-dependent epimerase/dehydratase family protein n=1 Tax=Actinomadura geliboluensis TaxID=882440 RepID=A0A5S4G8N5_9ACTN|nr:NAD-dependent epimerase/dehydratase family protein [Actinomadura geliboluensis]TMR29209.1 NAD-dependent epimerase/dehydratase family protein [Actinomadura geliboluensis]